MSVEFKFILLQFVIILPFISGYFLKGKFRDHAAVSKKLIIFSLVLIEPAVILWSIWGLRLYSEALFLPLIGLGMVVFGFIFGFFTAPFLKQNYRSRKTYLISSSIANHGFTMGGFICYLIAGESGLGFSSLFTLYFMPYTFLVIFSYARYNTGSEKISLSLAGKFLFNFQNMPLYASIAAILLNINMVHRPDINFPIDPLIVISVGIYYLTLGMNFDTKDITSIRKETVLISVLKFVIIPVLTIIFLSFTDFAGAARSVIIIQSFMPAAIYSVVSSILFDLDRRLASSMFVTNTLLFILLILPLILMLHTALFI